MDMTRLLRRLFGLGLLAVAGGWAAVGWVQSPGGAALVSRRVTSVVEKEIPGSRVMVSRIHLRWPPAALVPEVQWGKSGEPPILVLRDFFVEAGASEWWKGNFRWTVRGKVTRLDLAGLDQVLAKERWQAQGSLTGWVRLQGEGSQVRDLNLRLETQPPGGFLSNELIRRLLTLMPADSTRSSILQAIRQKERFHFDVGQLQVITHGDDYRLAFLLDGDHLLDIAIRIPKESVRVLREVVQ